MISSRLKRIEKRHKTTSVPRQVQRAPSSNPTSVYVFKWLGCDKLLPVRHYYQHFYFNIHGRLRNSNFGNFIWQLELSFLAGIKLVLKDIIFC